MRFWDSSAIIPLLVNEKTSLAITREHRRDPQILVWWTTPIECASALTRRERLGELDAAGLSDALARLADMEKAWGEIQPIDRVCTLAVRLLRVHPLTAADAMQLAAALVAAEAQPSTLPFVTLDRDLAVAAEREGLPVVGSPG